MVENLHCRSFHQFRGNDFARKDNNNNTHSDTDVMLNEILKVFENGQQKDNIKIC